MTSLLLSYFTAQDEALHLAHSTDGTHFEALNEGRPVLWSSVGTGRLRDPFIGLGPDGAYHLLATDGWTSPRIVHAVSTDLHEWEQVELLEVMAGVHGAHNAWAPEFFCDPATGEYHLVWSSVVDAEATADAEWEFVSQDHRIWSCSTRDFRTFSPARVFFDPGHSVIDATVVPAAGGFVMAYKDERGTNQLDTSHKDIHLTRFASPTAQILPGPEAVTPAPAEGPALFRTGQGWVLLFDRYLEGRYSARRSLDLQHWDDVDVVLPAGARHASVLAVDLAVDLPGSFPRTATSAGARD